MYVYYCRTEEKAVSKSRAIPKEETKIYDLFDNYPNSDGRGIKIAILDTGCDLNAAGLNGTTRYVHSLESFKTHIIYDIVCKTNLQLTSS